MKLSTTLRRLIIFLLDQHGAHGFGADIGGEGVLAIFVLRFEQFILGQQLILFERGQARLGDDVAFEVEYALELLQLHVEQQADAARQRLQEPDVRNRRGQLDVAHALTPDLGHGDFDAALFADDALVLHALVLAAQALVVLHGAEDARAEQPVTLRLEGAVVDRLGLLDLAIGPRADTLRRGDADLDLVEGFGLRQLVGEFGQVVHDCVPLGGLISFAAVAGGDCRPRAAYSAASSIAPSSSSSRIDFNSTLRPRLRISFTSTLKLSGMPASKVSSPLTIAS
jgi:hypothetical protein